MPDIMMSSKDEIGQQPRHGGERFFSGGAEAPLRLLLRVAGLAAKHACDERAVTKLTRLPVDEELTAMTPKTVCLLLLPFVLLVAPSSVAAPAELETPAPIPREVPGNFGPVKAFAKLEAKNAAGVPGETKTLEATLLSKLGDKPIAGKSVFFRIQSKDGSPLLVGTDAVSFTVPSKLSWIDVGAGTTDASGRAKVTWVVRDLVQANYTIKATFAGDAGTGPAADEGNVVVVKAVTAFDLSTVACSAKVAPSEHNPNPGACSITLSLKRTSDAKLLYRSIKLEVTPQGGTPATATLVPKFPNPPSHAVTLPGNAASWKVKVQFDGDGYYQATAGEQSYVRP